MISRRYSSLHKFRIHVNYCNSFSALQELVCGFLTAMDQLLCENSSPVQFVAQTMRLDIASMYQATASWIPCDTFVETYDILQLI
jgi:hypothetical protein